MHGTSILTTLITALIAGQGDGLDRLVELDGMVTEATVVAIDRKGQVHTATPSAMTTVTLDQLRRIERPIAIRKPDGSRVQVKLVDGSILWVRQVTITDDRCIVDWPQTIPLTLPLSVVRSLRFPHQATNQNAPPPPDVPPNTPTESPSQTPHASNGRASAIDTSETRFDRLLVNQENKLTSIEGVLQALGEKNATFIWQDQPRTIAREKIHTVVFAPSGVAPDLNGWKKVHLEDGSTLWAEVVTLHDGKLQLKTSGGVELSLPFDRVGELAIRSERMVFLSDLEPIEAVDQALVTYVMPWRRDRTVLGRTLTMDGITYEKGIGVHARSLLTFDVNRQFDVFAATIGIDDATRGRGDCEFVLLGDGKELFRQRMRATDLPEPLRLIVTGIAQLTLLVEPGEDLDLADHADWCDARLIRHDP